MIPSPLGATQTEDDLAVPLVVDGDDSFGCRA